MSRLAITVPFETGETPDSYVGRLARVNGLDEAWTFCRSVDLDLQGVVRGRQDTLEMLADLSGRTVPELSEWATTIDVADEAVLRGERMGQRWLERQGCDVCIECLDGDLDDTTLPFGCRTWQRGWWRVTGIRTCAVHDRPLHHLRWPYPDDQQHDDARQARPTMRRLQFPGKPVESRRPSAFEEYMLARITVGSRSSSVLDDIPMTIVSRLCRQTGLIANGRESDPYHPMSDDLQHQAEAEGYDVLKNGIEGLYAVLEAYFMRPGASTTNCEVWHVTNRLKKLFLGGEFSTHHIGPVRGILQDILGRFGGHRGEGGSDTHHRERSVRFALSTLAAKCGTTPTKARAMLLRTGMINEDLAGMRAERLFVPAGWTGKLTAMLHDANWPAKAAAGLSMPRSLLLDLVAAGLIEQLGANGVAEHGIRIANDALADFMHRLIGSAGSEGQRALSHDDTSRCDILMAATRTGVAAIEIVKAVLDGRLERSRVDPGRADFLSLLVSEEEVRNWFGVPSCDSRKTKKENVASGRLGQTLA